MSEWVSVLNELPPVDPENKEFSVDALLLIKRRSGYWRMVGCYSFRSDEWRVYIIGEGYTEIYDIVAPEGFVVLAWCPIAEVPRPYPRRSDRGGEDEDAQLAS